jgi:rifampicin phosphotransferase
MPHILFLNEIDEDDAGRVGAKALNLARSARAGLPVPPAFVVTTEPFRRLAERGARSDPAFIRALATAYRELGGGPVAVRSSALAEDAADTSFAGQQETILGVEGEEALTNALERCWQSLASDRAAAYRARQGVDDVQSGMAVVIQQLVPAEAAGVLFTRNPLDPEGKTMLAEAAWGLGEVVVSGRMQPDRFSIDRDTGAVVNRQLGLKSIRLTRSGEELVSAADQERYCLNDDALAALVELGKRVEAFYGQARDVEWAWSGGLVHLLQARPITVAGALEREEYRREAINELKAKADPPGTVWVRYNLSEVLPAPTPMTWSVIRRLLAADGGFGAMNRDLGAEPDPSLGSLSAFDLVAGRPMLNLSRLPRMQFARPPIAYPIGLYKAEPHRALDPKPMLNPLAGRGCLLGVLALPATVWKLTRQKNAIERQSASFATTFTTTIVPPFVSAARAALEQDWSKLDPPALVHEFESWVQRTLIDFARHSLKATVFADLAWNGLVEILIPSLGEERARTAVAKLALGAGPPEDVDLARGFRELTAGTLDRTSFLERFGHRGSNEMELAERRWSEAPDQLGRLIVGSSRPVLPTTGAAADWEAIADEAKLAGPKRDQFAGRVERLRSYLGLREAGKHYLLLGYAVIRRALVELDRRFCLHGGIYFLTPADFADLLAGKNLAASIAAARKRRQAELSLPVPPVLFSDDLDAIGRPPAEPAGGDRLEGVALSAGVCDGPALVMTEPTAAPADGGYVLVCPTTDPAWVPLFARALGLVMEIGGVLSHGAIVAREFGLPAVAALPDATRRIRTGQMIRVDGERGVVTLLSTQGSA